MKCINLDAYYTFLFEDKWPSFDYTNSTESMDNKVAYGSWIFSSWFTYL